MAFYSPLRYPGGKGKLANYIKAIIKSNKLQDGHYVEVYAGGAAVAIELLFQEYVSHIHINDFNPSIYAFWHSVLNETDELCKKIIDTPVNMDVWRAQKKIQANPHKYTKLALGLSTFFLNRTNRSGIIKGGVIGGKNQDGKWKLDARYNVKDLVKRIDLIAKYRNRISLYNLDAKKMIQNLLPKLPTKSLIYFDPPYYIKGEGLYDSYYLHNDHVEIAKAISRNIKRQRWIVSYDDVPEVFELYKGFRHTTYNLYYAAADRYQGSEVIFFCDNLLIPEISDLIFRGNSLRVKSNILKSTSP